MVTLNQFGSVPANRVSNANFTIGIINEIFRTFPNRFRFTSGYRTPARNAAVGGVPNSFHITGEAADFVPVDGRYPSGEKEAIAVLVSRYGYEVLKHNVGSGMHYHIEPAQSGKVTPSAGNYDVNSNTYHAGNLATVTVSASDGQMSQQTKTAMIMALGALFFIVLIRE